MAIFVVQARGLERAALERARFVAEAFSWPAFLLTLPWLAFHRLWLALVFWVLFTAAFALLLAPNLTGLSAAGTLILAKLFVGFEGNRLRLAKGARKAELTDVIAARDRDEAEAIFFRQQAEASVVHVPGDLSGAGA